MSSLAPVRKELLKWARVRASLSVADLTAKFPKYKAWEAGESQPTMHQLEQFAAKTHAPFGFLFLPVPPIEKMPVTDFRTMDGPTPDSSPELLDTLHAMQARQAWVREYLTEEGVPQLSFAGSISLKTPVASTVASMRRQLDMPENWAADLGAWSDALQEFIRRVESIGVMVMMNGVVGNNTRRKLDVEEFRGFALADGRAPLIFLNNADSKSAQMFTLAHELAHVWLGVEGVSGWKNMQPGSNVVEKYCNKVAAEFLVPEIAMEKAWPLAEGSNRPFHELAKKFKVSPLVVARRALDLRHITQEDFNAFYRSYLNTERKAGASGGNFYATAGVRLGTRFATLLFQAVGAERLGHSDAYRLAEMHGDTFHAFGRKKGYGK